MKNKIITGDKERQLQKFLLNEEGTARVSDALTRAKTKWRK